MNKWPGKVEQNSFGKSFKIKFTIKKADLHYNCWNDGQRMEEDQFTNYYLKFKLGNLWLESNNFVIEVCILPIKFLNWVTYDFWLVSMRSWQTNNKTQDSLNLTF